MKEVLRVRRKGTAMVPDYESHRNVRRFHGWKYDGGQGDEFKVHPGNLLPGEAPVKRQGAWVGHDDVIELPVTAEYIRHLRDGDLWPADAATASMVNVPFDPSFGAPTQAAAVKVKD